MEQNNSQTNAQYNSTGAGYNPNINSDAYSAFARNGKTKSKVLTFMLACVFGAGQMYQGQMKKGISIMVLTFAIIGVAGWLYIPWIALAIPVIWFYAFFDCVNKMNYTIDELRMLNDNYIFNPNLTKNKNISDLLGKRHLLFGVILLVVGIYALLATFTNSYAIEELMDERVYWYIENVITILPKFFIPVLITIIGFKLIVGNKSDSSNTKAIEEKHNSND